MEHIDSTLPFMTLWVNLGGVLMLSIAAAALLYCLGVVGWLVVRRFVTARSPQLQDDEMQ